MKLIPKDFNLIIKLNPLSQTPRPYKKLKDFWEAIENLNKTFLVDQTISTKKLIENCNCIATITGTAGFEANLLGKPTIYGGQSHYTDSPLSIRIQKINSAKAFNAWYEKVNNMDNSIKRKLMEDYLNNLNMYSVPGHYL